MCREAHVKRTAYVWEKPYTITIYQKTKSVWIVVGDYMGKPIQVKGGSEAAAKKLWEDAAKFKGN